MSRTPCLPREQCPELLVCPENNVPNSLSVREQCPELLVCSENNVPNSLFVPRTMSRTPCLSREQCPELLVYPGNNVPNSLSAPRTMSRTPCLPLEQCPELLVCPRTMSRTHCLPRELLWERRKNRSYWGQGYTIRIAYVCHLMRKESTAYYLVGNITGPVARMGGKGRLWHPEHTYHPGQRLT